MRVTETEGLFSAVDMRDGTYIVAKVGLENVVTIQKIIEGQVTVVMPLNLQSKIEEQKFQ